MIKGKILLGEKPEATIYHFWFGDFSLGYGGWLSPTEIDGVSGFRIGLAKLKEEKKGIEQLFQLFIDRLVQEKILEITDEKVEYTFGSHIPIGGVLSRIQNEACILIGDAAGYCGAFAADGIK